MSDLDKLTHKQLIYELKALRKKVAQYENDSCMSKDLVALEEEKRFIQTVLNTVDSLVLVLNRRGQIVLFNRACEVATGYSFDEVQGKYVWDILIRPEELEGVKKVFANLKAGFFPNRHVNYWKNKNGNDVLIMWSNTAVLDENGEVDYIIPTGIDITQQEIDKKEREQLERKLQQAQKLEAVGTLAGGIAHDFNNILSVILGYSDLGRQEAPPGSELSEHLEEILLAGLRAKNLVHQILAFSRQTHLEKVSIYPHTIIKEVLKMLRSSIPTTIKIQENISEDCGSIDADPTQFQQIILNLCTNAFHAMEEKGGLLKISLQIAESIPIELKESDPEGEKTFIELAISDTGKGIGTDIISKIFDPYFTTKDEGKGTGMGLAISYGIVKDYGGMITVDTEVGQGTTFHVYLPLNSQATAPEIAEELSPPKGSERILFVDDEKPLAEMGKRILEKLGYQVKAEYNSTSALKTFQKEPDRYDLVITDQTMPEMTGFDLSKHLLKIRPGLPIILCTGYSSLVDEDGVKAQGIKGYALKPYTMTTIAQLVRKLLDGTLVTK